MTTVQDLSALKEVQAQQQEQGRIEKKLQKDLEIKERLFNALQLFPNGETATALREAAGISSKTSVMAYCEQLVQEARALRCTVKKNNGQEKAGYKPVTFGSNPDTQGT